MMMITDAQQQQAHHRIQISLRRRFFDDYRSQIEQGKFAVEDVRRVRIDDSWLNQFIRRSDGDLDVALPILVECLKWRQDFGVNHMSVLQLKPYLERQVMYIRGTDADHNAILWFNVKNHRKDNPEKDSQSLLVYWLEKHNREKGDARLVVVFDMSGAGLQNMDLELIRFLLHCLKFYYPCMLAYLLVYEIPWILNAAWKLVRSWLDPVAQKKIVFVNQSTVQQYIQLEDLPRHMGGNSDYVFSMDHLVSDCGSRNLYLDVDGEGAPTPDSDYMSLESEYKASPGTEEFPSLQLSPSHNLTGTALLDSEPEPFRRKTVTFADQNSIGTAISDEGIGISSAFSEETVNSKSEASVDSPSGKSHHQYFSRSLSAKAKEIAEMRLDSLGGQAAHGQILAIIPSSELVLQAVAGEQERVDVICLRNPRENPVAFKIKITSPQKFRVRPSSGVIRPGERTTVKVYLQTGYQDTVYRDKFLILSLEVPEGKAAAVTSPENLVQLWKDAPHDVVEHRLKCRVDDGESSLPGNNPNPEFLSPRNESSPPILGNCESGSVLDQLRNENRVMKVMLVVACSLLAVLFIHQRIMFGSLQAQIQGLTGNAQCFKQ